MQTDSSSFGAGWRAGDTQTTPLLAGNATGNLLCHRLGSKGGEIVEWLYFFFQVRHVFLLSLRFSWILEWKESLFSVYSCVLRKMGSCTMAFMTKNSDADISGKGKSQRIFCWYMSCRLKCWHFVRKLKLEMVRSAQSLQWAQKKPTQNVKEKHKYLWIGEGIFSYSSWQISHLFTERNCMLCIPSAKSLTP